MSRAPRRVTLRIDRVSVDAPGIDRAALEAALRREIERTLASRRGEALQASRYRSVVQADLPAGGGRSVERIARAVLKGTLR